MPENQEDQLNSMWSRLLHIARAESPGIACAVGLSILFAVLVSRDLDSWQYCYIGDEYIHYQYAMEINQGIFKPSVFSQNGVWGLHPQLDLIYQASILRLLGGTNFAWRFSSVLVSAVSVLLVYILGRIARGMGVGLVAAFLFASSQHLWAYSHVGVNNLFSLPYIIMTFIFAFSGLKWQRSGLFFLSGCFSGMGFYTFYTGRIPIIVVSLFLAARIKSEKHGVRYLLVYIVGFACTFLPFLIKNGAATFSYMIGQTAPHVDVNQFPFGRLGLIYDNFKGTLVGILYSHDVSNHFVSGSLVDDISGISFLIGLVLVARKPMMREIAQLLLLWLILGAFIAGGLFYQPGLAYTRLHVILPPICLIAAIGIESVITRIQGWDVRILARSIVLVMALALNIFRFYYWTPLVKPKPEPMMMMKKYQEGTATEEDIKKIPAFVFPLYRKPAP